MKKLSLVLVSLIIAGALQAGETAGTSSKEATKPACCSGDMAAMKAAVKAPAAEKMDMKKAVAEYPLDKCVVSGESLDEMDKPVDYVYSVEGQPDRLVRLCCNKCVTKFKKDPAKYLAAIDAAKASAGKTATHDHAAMKH